MKLIRTREDLLEMAARCAPTTAIGVRIRTNGATVLGGFNPVERFPGWIVRSGFRLIGIELDECNRRYRICYPATVPWANWRGQSDGKWPLVDGDRPIESALERMKARSKHGGKRNAAPSTEDRASAEILEEEVRSGRDPSDGV